MNLEELKQLAIGATWRNDCDDRFRAAANPVTVLELIERIKELEAEREELLKQEPCGWMHKDAGSTTVFNQKYMIGEAPEGMQPVYAEPVPAQQVKELSELSEMYTGQIATLKNLNGEFIQSIRRSTEAARAEVATAMDSIRNPAADSEDFTEQEFIDLMAEIFSEPQPSPAVAVPDGWKLVPIKEDVEMRSAGFMCGGVTALQVGEIYSAMLSAAPSPPSAEHEEWITCGQGEITTQSIDDFLASGTSEPPSGDHIPDAGKMVSEDAQDVPPSTDYPAEITSQRWSKESEILAANAPPSYEAKRVAPWTDFAGNKISEGDTIQHPRGQRATVVYRNGYSNPEDAWIVEYEGYDKEDFGRLCLQIGDKGKAVVANAEGGKR